MYRDDFGALAANGDAALRRSTEITTKYECSFRYFFYNFVMVYSGFMVPRMPPKYNMDSYETICDQFGFTSLLHFCNAQVSELASQILHVVPSLLLAPF